MKTTALLLTAMLPPILFAETIQQRFASESNMCARLSQGLGLTAGTNELDVSDWVTPTNQVAFCDFGKPLSPETDEDRVLFNELFASFTNLIASVSESTRPGWAGSKLAAWAEQGPETNLAWVPIQGVNPHRPGPRMRRESRYSDEEVRHGRRRNQMARAILLRFVLNSLETGTDEVVPSEMLLAVTSLWGKDLVEHVDRQGENKCREHRMTDGFSALDSMRAIYGAFRDSDHVDEQTKREVEYILSCLEQKDSP